VTAAREGFYRMRRGFHLFSRAWLVLRDEGPRRLLARVFTKLGGVLGGGGGGMMVADDDAALVDWTDPPNRGAQVTVSEGPVEIAWISSPPGAESGGHQNLFRFIKFAEDAGHRSTIYLYDQADRSHSDVKAMLKASSAYPDLKARIVGYDPAVGVAPQTQAIFATGWETAYPAFRDPSPARRFYFVQDYEPSFYATGSQSVLAENTYRFGFHGITAGGWLATKLRDDYGMTTDHFDFAVDRSRYNLTNEGRRNEIFFYARPVTPRRAFEFGMLALSEFARMRPEVAINLAGWNVAGWDVPFRHVNHSSLDISQLNGLYNRCAAGLVISLTNLSLLPLELASSGAVPVVNDAPNNRLVSDRPFIEWVPLSPGAIARRLVEVLDRPDAPERAKRMSDSLSDEDWSKSGTQFLSAFERAMRG
jgi:hypothetical protein